MYQLDTLKQALEALSNCEGMLPEYHQWLSDTQFELRKLEEAAEIESLRKDADTVGTKSPQG